MRTPALFAAFCLFVLPAVPARSAEAVKMPPQPTEWVAPAADLTPPMAEARFGKAWKRDRTLPKPLAGHSAVLVGSHVYVLGGVSGKEHLGVRDIYSARAGKDGLGPWGKAGVLPVPTCFGAAVAVGKRIYVLGGSSREGMLRLYDSVWSAEAGNGKVGKWREETKAPAAVMYPAAAECGGYLYMLGGFNGQEYNGKLSYAKIGANGKLGEWATAKAVYPQPIGRSFMAGVAGDLVVMGGMYWDSQGEHITAVMIRGKRSADGGVESWESEGGLKVSSRSMNFSLAEQGGCQDGNFLYMAGGRDPAALGVATVQASWITPDGKLSRWQFGPDMPAWGQKGPVQPVRLYQSACVASNDRLFVVGGFLSIREPTKNTWSIELKPYKEPEWVKQKRASGK